MKHQVDLIAYCQQNLGDDLFVIHLARRYPNVRFRLLGLSVKGEAFSDIDNIVVPTGLQLLARRIWQKVISRIPIIDVRISRRKAVFIGGSIFPETKDALENIVKRFKKFGDYYIIGCNLDQNYSLEFIDCIRDVFTNSKGSCLRDNYSYNMLGQLENTHYAPDILFGLKTVLERKIGHGVAISVISPEQKNIPRDKCEEYYNVLSKFCDWCEKSNIEVTLLSFCKIEGDEKAIDEILKRVNNKKYPHKCTYNGKITDMLGQINECEHIIASRFHAMIIGWVLGKNVFPIVYNSKQSNVMEDIAFKGPFWNLLDDNQTVPVHIWEKLIQQSGRVSIGRLRDEADTQFMYLDKLFKD